MVSLAMNAPKSQAGDALVPVPVQSVLVEDTAVTSPNSSHFKFVMNRKGALEKVMASNSNVNN